MKKVIKFSKPYGKLLGIKKDFYQNNYRNLKETLSVNQKYIAQGLRKKCKNCNLKISNFDFKSHKVKYVSCRRCMHINGIYEDSNKFVNWLYNQSSGKNYAKNYLTDYNARVKNIYLPKVNFLKTVIKKKNLKIVDIGSGAGHFVKACEIKKIKAIGYEPNEILADLAMKKLNKNKVFHIPMDFLNSEIISLKADCLSLIGVLEHLQNPREIIKSFKLSKLKYLYLSVPLFSLTALIEHISPTVFPRHLSGAHTHLYTLKSLNYLFKQFNLKIVAEWWFGSDFADLYRLIKVLSNKNKKLNELTNKFLFNHIDELQNILDKNKTCNEVHLIVRKK